MMSVTDPGAKPRALRLALLSLRILLAAVFLLAGGLKIYGLPRLVVEFQHIGLGEWFRYATGLLEISGAVALLVPGLAVLGAGLLACIMVGAIATHLFIFGDSAVAAFVLFALSLTILVTHRYQLADLYSKLFGANVQGETSTRKS